MPCRTRFALALAAILSGMFCLPGRTAAQQSPPANPDASSLMLQEAASPQALAATSSLAPPGSPLSGPADPPAAGPPGGGTGLTRGTWAVPVAGWQEGFFLQSPDKSFLLRITGQIQVDYRQFINPADTTDIDTFLLRRARLGIEATMLDYYEFRLLPDFAGSSPTITDAYLNVHYWDAFQFTVGKFKQPVSYEQLIQDRYVPTMERSMIDQLVPARDEGAMIHGRNLFDKRLDYAVSVSNGEINGNGDTNDGKDVDGRVAVRPFAGGQLDWLRRLQVGVSGGTGVENEPVNPNTYKTPATVPWFAYKSGVVADGVRSRLTPELAYFFHSFGFATQYYYQDQELRPSASSALLIDVPINGFYVMGTYLLTGEQRFDYTQQIDPICPFDLRMPFSHPGAWEAVVRFSHLEVDSKVFATGAANLADPTKYSPAATESTIGFNWYWNKWGGAAQLGTRLVQQPGAAGAALQLAEHPGHGLHPVPVHLLSGPCVRLTGIVRPERTVDPVGIVVSAVPPGLPGSYRETRPSNELLGYYQPSLRDDAIDATVYVLDWLRQPGRPMIA